MATHDTPDAVDVVVVTYNPGDTLETFLASLPKAGASLASVVVADSDSPQPAPPAIAKRYGATVHAMPQNKGFGAAANAGATYGEAPWILVSNADIVCEPGAIDALVAAGMVHGAMAVGPRILETSGDLYPSARPLPSVALGLGHAALGKLWPGNPWSARYRTLRAPESGGAAAGWLSGSCFLVRRDVFTQLNGFDEAFFMFFEDVDLGRRIAELGGVSWWEPSATVTHIGGHSWRKDPAPMLRAHHRSAARYVGLAYPRWFHAPLRVAARIGLALRERLEVASARRHRAH